MCGEGKASQFTSIYITLADLTHKHTYAQEHRNICIFIFLIVQMMMAHSQSNTEHQQQQKQREKVMKTENL